MPRRILGTAGVVALLALGAAACGGDSGSSAKQPTTTTSATVTSTSAATTTTVAAGAVGGTYTNGSTDVPHYSVVLQTSNGDGIGGTMMFVFQDGTSQQTFTFSGTASGGTASVTPSSGSAISFTYTPTQLVFENCSAYLQYATQASQCTFTLQ